jgi:AcrR family transcriptional regulator
MKNKEIQDQRMKGYFIQATKELLKSEGLIGVNVRSVAEKAGYSYTTMYNYFKDLNELIFYCVEDFYNECKEFTEERTANTPDGIEKLKLKIAAYSHYFIEYPGIFDLFFLERMGNLRQKKTATDLISLSLDRVCETDWKYCLDKKLIQSANPELIKSQVRYTIVGILLLYINRMSPETYPEFIQQINNQLDNIIR